MKDARDKYIDIKTDHLKLLSTASDNKVIFDMQGDTYELSDPAFMAYRWLCTAIENLKTRYNTCVFIATGYNFRYLECAVTFYGIYVRVVGDISKSKKYVINDYLQFYEMLYDSFFHDFVAWNRCIEKDSDTKKEMEANGFVFKDKLDELRDLISEERGREKKYSQEDKQIDFKIEDDVQSLRFNLSLFDRNCYENATDLQIPLHQYFNVHTIEGDCNGEGTICCLFDLKRLIECIYATEKKIRDTNRYVFGNEAMTLVFSQTNNAYSIEIDWKDQATDKHVYIKKDGLSYEEFEEYVKPVKCWGERYLKDEKISSILHDYYDMREGQGYVSLKELDMFERGIDSYIMEKKHDIPLIGRDDGIYERLLIALEKGRTLKSKECLTYKFDNPIIIAAYRYDRNMLIWLIEHGADVKVAIPDSEEDYGNGIEYKTVWEWVYERFTFDMNFDFYCQCEKARHVIDCASVIGKAAGENYDGGSYKIEIQEDGRAYAYTTGETGFTQY